MEKDKRWERKVQIKDIPKCIGLLANNLILKSF